MGLESHAPELGLTVEESLRGVLALGLLEAENVQMEPVPRRVRRGVRREAAPASRASTPAGRRPTSPGVAETRALFHRLGVDPTKTRPSSEALLRRVVQGKGLPRVNLAVDVCNLCSLEHQLPLGLYDREYVKGAVQRARRPRRARATRASASSG